MKKIDIFIVVMMALLCVLSSYKYSVINDQSFSEYVAPKEMPEFKNNVSDNAFWDSAAHHTDLVANALDRNCRIQIDYRLNIDEKTDFSHKIWLPVAVRNDYDPVAFSEYLQYRLATDRTVKAAHDAGQKVEVTGVILRWRDKKNWHSRKLVDYSACELDSVDNWDYASIGKMDWFGLPHAVGPDYEIRGVELMDLSPVQEDETTLGELYRRAHW